MKEKFYTITLHCIGWLFFFSLPGIFIASQSYSNSNHFFTGNLLNFLSFGIYIVIFYVHTYYLFPVLFFRKKWLLYFLSIVLLLLTVVFFRPFDRSVKEHQPENELTNNYQNSLSQNGPDQFGHSPNNDGRQTPPGNGQGQYSPPSDNGKPLPPLGNSNNTRHSFNPSVLNVQRTYSHIDIVSIALFMLVIAVSLILILEKRLRLAVEQTTRAEADKANAELSFLKAQINPHFLFNTLNNIYALAIIKSDDVADAIMKLSNIMRYVTDDVNEDFVSLEKEVSSISDYISLQKLRLGKKAAIDFIVEGNIGSKMIAPLILMPFVENVFTHGISNSAPSAIIIKLTATEKHLVFYTENKLFERPRNIERMGIGTANTKKRLAQIYPDKYLLEIKSKDGLFTVDLVLYI